MNILALMLVLFFRRSDRVFISFPQSITGIGFTQLTAFDIFILIPYLAFSSSWRFMVFIAITSSTCT